MKITEQVLNIKYNINDDHLHCNTSDVDAINIQLKYNKQNVKLLLNKNKIWTFFIINIRLNSDMPNFRQIKTSKFMNILNG